MRLHGRWSGSALPQMLQFAAIRSGSPSCRGFSIVHERCARRFNVSGAALRLDQRALLPPLLRGRRRGSLPSACGNPRGTRVSKRYAPARSSRADACERQCLCRPHRRIRRGWTRILRDDFALRFERAPRASAHVSNRARSGRAMGRLLCAWARRDRRDVGLHHPDRHGLHLTVRATDLPLMMSVTPKF